MGLLGSCWFIIENIIIPNGYIKLFYLSFYIHPIFLFFFQIFIWLKELWSSLLLLFFFLSRIARFLGLFIFKFKKRVVLFFLHKSTRIEVEDEIEVDVFYDVIMEQEIQNHEIVVSSSCIVHEFQPKVLFQEESSHYTMNSLSPLQLCSKHSSEDLYKEEVDCDLPSDQEIVEILENHPNKSLELNLHLIDFNHDLEDINYSDVDETLSPLSCLNSTLALEQRLTTKTADKEADSFYRMYIERMRWYDILCRDRLFGINALVHGSWNTMENKMVVKSLESDLELTYVGQMCLSWEALYYQYTKVEKIINSENEELLHKVTAADDFQKFQVLLERFMEDEKSWEGKRYENFIHKRFSFKSLLHVPHFTGPIEEESETIRGDLIRASETFKAIERCIKAFLLFVKSDNKATWKFRGILAIHPPRVEDPRDLDILYDMTRKLQKKWLLLKDVQGKKKCCLKRTVNPMMGESQKMDVLLTTIDIKLVERVLKMSIISTSHLKWCEEKLNNLEFKNGKVTRPHTSYLFPTT